MNNTPPNNITTEELSLIDQYLHKELDAEKLHEFEERRAKDKSFRSKVEEVRSLVTGITEVALQNKLKIFHEEMLAQEDSSGVIAMHSRTKPSSYRWWAAASAAILIIATSWWFLKKDPAERLYQAYFVPDIGLPVVMGSNDSVSYTFYDGMVSYKEEKYADAISKWESLAKTEGYTDTLRYYMGMAMLNQDHLAKAEDMLAPVVESTGSSLRSDAAWYMALIQLKKGNKSKAVSLLKELNGKAGAKELLKALE